MIDRFLCALQMLMENKATRVVAGDIIFQLIIPGLIFIRLGDRNFLFEQISGQYNLREVL